MIVKCNCDCKYCEEGICSKEEITMCDTGEGINCYGYEQLEDSFLVNLNLIGIQMIMIANMPM